MASPPRFSPGVLSTKRGSSSLEGARNGKVLTRAVASDLLPSPEQNSWKPKA